MCNKRQARVDGCLSGSVAHRNQDPLLAKPASDFIRAVCIGRSPITTHNKLFSYHLLIYCVWLHYVQVGVNCSISSSYRSYEQSGSVAGTPASDFIRAVHYP